MRHILAAVLLILIFPLLLLPSRALAAADQGVELASSLIAMASYSDELSLLAREWLAEEQAAGYPAELVRITGRVHPATEEN